MTQYLLSFLLVVILLTCAQPETKPAPPSPKRHTKDRDLVEKPVANEPQERPVRLLDSIQVFGHIFKTYQLGDSSCLINSIGDTVIHDWHYQMGLTQTDFNRDGVDDILIDYFPVPPVQDLMMFNPETRRFVLVENFRDFPEPEPIRGTRYFYSYHRAGCADGAWVSDLFYIDNYKAIHIGHINGTECGGNTKDGIYISKIKGKRKTPVVTFPIEMIYQYRRYKWGFIKAYWSKNYDFFAAE